MSRERETGTAGVECTIVIPCRNEAGSIREFCDSLLAQERTGEAWEIIFADGQSDDGTAEILAGYAADHPEITVMANPERIVPTGLNRAVRAAAGEFIVRMDVHTVYAPDYVKQCLAVSRETGAMNVGGAARTRATGRRARAIAAAYGSPFAVGGARFHFPSYEGPVDTVTYGCWRRDDLLEVGLFDESLVRNQDDELNLRIRKAGGVVWQDPRIRSWYTPRADLGKLFRQYYQYGFWKVAVIRKHRLPASWRHLVPAALVASLVVLGVASVFWAPARWLLAAEAALYAAFLAAGSLHTASRRGWDLLPLLPAVIACFHVSYGSGFLAALIAGPKGRFGLDATRLTR